MKFRDLKLNFVLLRHFQKYVLVKKVHVELNMRQAERIVNRIDMMIQLNSLSVENFNKLANYYKVKSIFALVRDKKALSYSAIIVRPEA